MKKIIQGKIENTYLGIMSHRDPAYTFYKAGYFHLHKGRGIFNIDRYSLENRKNIFFNDSRMLAAALNALDEYTISFKYFTIVRDRYSRSEWSNDAVDKLNEISKLNERYGKIINHLQMSKNNKFNQTSI